MKKTIAVTFAIVSLATAGVLLAGCGSKEKKTEVKQKDGTVKVIQKYKRKKTFWKIHQPSCACAIPARIERKAEAVGGVYAEVDTKEFKASQYNHVTDTYEKDSVVTKRKGDWKIERYKEIYIRHF